MAEHGDQRFRVFDVVDVLNRPPGTPGRMVVCEVRLYGDGSYKYSVSNVDTDDDTWGGLYPEDSLSGTGSQVDPSLLEMPGPFGLRDVVVVSATHHEPGLRDRRGVVEGWFEGDGTETIGVWFDDLERFDTFKPEDLTATGEKVPRQTPDTLTTSSKVGPDGALLGTEEYVLVDDLKFHL